MMKKNKECNYCNITKPLSYFHRDKSTNDTYSRRCIKCTRSYYTSRYKKKNMLKGPHFLYGDGDVLKNKQYLKERTELFKSHGNGWWWEYKDRVKRKKPKRKE